MVFVQARMDGIFFFFLVNKRKKRGDRKDLKLKSFKYVNDNMHLSLMLLLLLLLLCSCNIPNSIPLFRHFNPTTVQLSLHIFILEKILKKKKKKGRAFFFV